MDLHAQQSVEPRVFLEPLLPFLAGGHKQALVLVRDRMLSQTALEIGRVKMLHVRGRMVLTYKSHENAAQSLTALVATLVSRTVADCSSASIQALLPSIASVDFVFWQAGGSTFSVPNGDIAYPTSPTNLTAHCAVQIRVTNGTSQYGFGMFLPDNWNGRFLAVGNGGYAGGINWLDMGGGLGYGFAVMSTDTGHNSTAFDGTWAYGQQDKLKDWGYRAMHGSTVLGKQLTQSYYGY
ncbi:putative ferulic acid Esterase/Feruloyl esterase, partial [Aureobasidium melanogenum]